MDKMDFKGALDEYKNASDSWCHAELFCNHGDTIQTALRIAERLQSGEVSDGMQCVVDLHCNYKYPRKETFKAMSQQLIKECGDDE